MFKKAIFLLSIVAAPALAQSPMTAEEFEAYTKGKTLYFAADGMRYGVEEYLSDRRVRWSFLDGECKDGYWYQQGSQICFEYEDNPIPQCWTFYKLDGRLGAVFEAEDGPETELYEVEGDGKMECLGPKVGV